MTTVKRRRTKGEGSITKNTNGTYRVRLDCGYVGGKRKQLSATCDTLSQARVKLREFEKLRDETNIAISTEMTLQQLCKNYVEYKTQRGDIKPTTNASYNSLIKTFPETLMKLPIIKATSNKVDEFITSLKISGYKDSSIMMRLVFLKSVFNYAIKKLKVINRSPLDDCIKITKPNAKSDIEILSEEEHARLRGYLSKHYHYEHANLKPYPSALGFTYIAYMLAYELGLREGEVLGLRWSRINFKQNTIMVDNQRVNLPHKGSLDAAPKTESSIRLLVVSQGLIKILTEHRNNYHFDDDYVFSKGHNKVLSHSALISGFKKALEKAGITRHFTFHMIRHTNATRLIEKSGNDYKTVSERLGHATVSTTFNIYAHTIKKQHQLAAQLMDCTK